MLPLVVYCIVTSSGCVINGNILVSESERNGSPPRNNIFLVFCMSIKDRIRSIGSVAGLILNCFN